MRMVALCLVIGTFCFPAFGKDLMPKPLRPARDQAERAAKAVEQQTKPVLKKVGHELEDAGKRSLRDPRNQTTVSQIVTTPPVLTTEEKTISPVEGGDSNNDEKNDVDKKPKPLTDEYPNASRYVEYAWNAFKLYGDATDQSNWSGEEKRYQQGNYLSMIAGNDPEPGSNADKWRASNRNTWRIPMLYPKTIPSVVQKSQPVTPASKPAIVPRLP